MKYKKKAAFLGVLVFVALVIALPATRDELEWYWTKSRDQVPDYVRYCADWPKGRHIVEARQLFEERTWNDTKRAMINEAIKRHSADQSDPEARQERKLRLELFFWKEVTNENTILSYKDYLMRYPAGQFAPQAHRKIDDLTRQQSSESAPANRTDQLSSISPVGFEKTCH